MKQKRKSTKTENSNRGTGPRGPDGRFSRKEDKPPTTPELSQSQEEQLDTSPETPNIPKSGTFGRGKPRFIRNRETSTSPEKQPGRNNNKPMGPLTINAEQMSESDIDQVINDTQQSGQDLHMKDINENTAKRLNLSPPLETTEEMLEREDEDNQ